MGNTGRWQEPTDRNARDEYRTLRRELKLSRTTKARGAEIEARLDEIAGGEPPRPSTVPTAARWGADIQAWEWTDNGRKLLMFALDGKVRWASADEKPVSELKEPSSQIREPKPTTFDSEAWLARSAAEIRERALRKAASASPVEKAEALLADLPEHPLNRLARETARSIWDDDRSNPKANFERQVQYSVKHYLSDELWNRSDIRGSRATVDAAVADVLKLVAEKDAADPQWFVKRAEAAYAAPPTASKPVQTDPVEPTPIAAERTDGEIKRMATRKPPAAPAPVCPEPEPALNPMVCASMDLAARAALVLRNDSWLSRLAEHSPDMRTKILASLSDELLRSGCVNGDFAAKLYNSSRPKNVSAFPERKF